MIDLIASKITNAKTGNVEAAKDLLTEFIATIENNRRIDSLGEKVPHNSPSGIHTQFDEILLDYLAECFAKIGTKGNDGKYFTADIALNLSAKGKRGRKTSTKTRDELLVRGYRVHKAYRAKTGKNDYPAYQTRTASSALTDIIEKMAEETNLSVATIARDYAAWRKCVKEAVASMK